MSTSIAELSNQLAKFSLPSVGTISVQLVNRHSRKAELLVDNQDPNNSLKTRNQKYSLEFKTPLFINSIEFETESFPGYKDLEIGWKSAVGGNKAKRQRKPSNGVFQFLISDVISEFYFKPPKAFLSDPKITSIRIFGLQLSEFESACDKLSKVDQLRSKLQDEVASASSKFESARSGVQDASQRLAELNSQRDEITEEIHELEDQFELSKDKLASVNQDFEARKVDVANLETRVSELDGSIDKKEKQRSGLNSELTEKEKELKELKQDINLFPSEISGFVQQGARNVFRYTLLAAIPIILLAVYTYALFSGAADLTRIYAIPDSLPEDFDLWTLIWSRVPFALISLFLIHASYKIVRLFMEEIIEINKQRLNLSKISIIAKDVSEAGSFGCDFSDDEIYELRTKLKMDVLREHLKGYLPDDYEYDLDISIWDRFLKHRSNQPTDDVEDQPDASN